MEKQLKDVKIRMYRQGLGDCFLLLFFYEGEEQPATILIDCGVLSHSDAAKELMQRVAANIVETTGNKIDILAATHEHWDHLSGFEQAHDIFKEMKIDELWMAWTEDDADPDAGALKEAHVRKLATVHLAYKKLQAQKAISSHQEKAFQSFFSLFGLEADAKKPKTAQAFEKLKNRTKTRKKYCHPGTVITREQALPGVRIYILGPPKDRKALRKMNPTARNPEVYHLAGSVFGDNIYYALHAEEGGSLDTFTPFGRRAGIAKEDIEKYRKQHDSAKWPVDVFKTYTDKRNKWRQIETEWLNIAGRLAIHLDNGINNTSLAMAIELVDSGKVLLFPADAQIGNWLSWKNHVWEIRDHNKAREIKVADLLARTVFYKVGHHGSHNATMKEEGLEKMTSEKLVAMVPVNRESAKNKGWNMPYDKLFKALVEKTHNRIIMADSDENTLGDTQELYHEIIIKN